MRQRHNKHRVRKEVARIRDVLMREWDTINVSGAFKAADEYDSYVGMIYLILSGEHTNHEEVGNYYST